MAQLRDIKLPGRRRIAARHLEVSYARSSGPGGQRTNKVETKVDLRLDLTGASEVLSGGELARIRRRLHTRLDAEGRLQVQSQAYRERSQNLDDALFRLEELLAEALYVPKRRKKTRPTRGSKERRLKEKKRRGDIKKARKSPDH